MDTFDQAALKQEIDALIAELDEPSVVAKPASERAVLAKIRALLDSTRDQRTGAARETWEVYLPYAANLCNQLTRLEPGWEDLLEYFASENSQFWLDCCGAFIEQGDVSGVKNALARTGEATRLIKQDWIARVDILLQALEFALEISDKKHAILLYEEAEKNYRRRLSGGAEYTGSAWLPKIKKMGRQLAQANEKLRRYYQYAETVTVSLEADSARDLERVIDYLQQNLTGKIKITRRVKNTEQPEDGPHRARLKITLE